MTGEELAKELAKLPSIGTMKLLDEEGRVFDVHMVEGEAQPDGSYVIWLRAEESE